MDTEIELKFLVSDLAAEQLTSIIQSYADAVMSFSTKQLHNEYFDTEDSQLRKHDIGLRIRCAAGACEQTCKLAGKVVGGLHQRPEYNQPLPTDSCDKPNLSLFPSDIWPEGLNPNELQHDLQSLFKTDFTRHAWVVSYRDSEVEIVFDEGEISSNGRSEAISEVEVELISGTIDALFEFAELLLTEANARLGSQSKAARGYRLMKDEDLQAKESLDAVPLSRKESIENTFLACMEYAIGFVQYHEACYFSRPSLSALRRLSDGVALIRHCFWVFSDTIPEAMSKNLRKELKWLLKSFDWVENARQLRALLSKKKKYRKRVDVSEHLLEVMEHKQNDYPDAEAVQALISSTRYNLLMLRLSRWLVEKRWLVAMDDTSLEKIRQPASKLARRLLDDEWKALREAMPEVQQDQGTSFIKYHKALKRGLMTGTCFGALFEFNVRQEFREPWIDLSRGIDELKTLQLMGNLASELPKSEDDDRVKIDKWLENQFGSLLLAMGHTRSSSLKMIPYWLD